MEHEAFHYRQLKSMTLFINKQKENVTIGNLLWSKRNKILCNRLIQTPSEKVKSIPFAHNILLLIILPVIPHHVLFYPLHEKLRRNQTIFFSRPPLMTDYCEVYWVHAALFYQHVRTTALQPPAQRDKMTHRVKHSATVWAHWFSARSVARLDNYNSEERKAVVTWNWMQYCISIIACCCCLTIQYLLPIIPLTKH